VVLKAVKGNAAFQPSPNPKGAFKKSLALAEAILVLATVKISAQDSGWQPVQDSTGKTLYKLERGWLTVILDDTLIRAKANECVEMVLQVNENLPENRNIRWLEIEGSHKQDSSGVIRYFEMMYDTTNRKIIASGDLFRDSMLYKAGIIHESAHAKFRGLPDSGRGLLAGLYKKMMKKAGLEPYLPYNKFALLSAWGIADNDSLIKIFDESNYFSRLPREAGHPFDNENELFASASVVLKYAPKQFLKNLEKLKVESAEKYELAREIARAVLLEWNDSRLFSAKLHKKLGLQHLMEKNY